MEIVISVQSKLTIFSAKTCLFLVTKEVFTRINKIRYILRILIARVSSIYQATTLKVTHIQFPPRGSCAA